MVDKYESRMNEDNDHRDRKHLETLWELRDEISFSEEEIRTMIQDSKKEWGK